MLLRAILAPCCTAMWSMRKASASLWIASQQEVLRAAKQDTLPDTARELLNFRSCGVLLVGMEVHGGPVVSNDIFLYIQYFSPDSVSYRFSYFQ